MMTPLTVLGHVKAEPFRPFVIQMASGRSFEIRHPEMIKVLKSYLLIFKTIDGNSELPEEFDTVSLMLAESISHLEVTVR